MRSDGKVRSRSLMVLYIMCRGFGSDQDMRKAKIHSTLIFIEEEAVVFSPRGDALMRYREVGCVRRSRGAYRYIIRIISLGNFTVVWNDA